MLYKTPSYQSVTPSPPKQLTLALDGSVSNQPQVMVLPPMLSYDDPEFVRAAIERVRLENQPRKSKRPLVFKV